MKNNSNKNKNKQDINNNLFNNIFKHISLRKNKTFYKDSYSEIKNKNDDIINYNEDINYENIYPINKSTLGNFFLFIFLIIICFKKGFFNILLFVYSLINFESSFIINDLLNLFVLFILLL